MAAAPLMVTVCALLHWMFGTFRTDRVGGGGGVAIVITRMLWSWSPPATYSTDSSEFKVIPPKLEKDALLATPSTLPSLPSPAKMVAGLPSVGYFQIRLLFCTPTYSVELSEVIASARDPLKLAKVVTYPLDVWTLRIPVK